MYDVWCSSRLLDSSPKPIIVLTLNRSDHDNDYTRRQCNNSHSPSAPRFTVAPFVPSASNGLLRAAIPLTSANAASDEIPADTGPPSAGDVAVVPYV